MDPDPHRRRPRAGPPAPPGDEPIAASPARPALGRNPFAVVVWAALVIVAGVVAVAFATGTADELPWGAIIGVVAVLAFAYAAGRRRRRIGLGGEDEPS